MSFIVTIIHVAVSLFLMLTVLLQAGKGGGMGSALGGGSSQGSVFGGSGAGNFLRRLTSISAATFMLTSMTLAYLASDLDAEPLFERSGKARAQAVQKQKMKEEASETYLESLGDAGAQTAPITAPEGSAPEGEQSESSTLPKTEDVPVEPMDPEDDSPAPKEQPTPEGKKAVPQKPVEAKPPKKTEAPPPVKPAPEKSAKEAQEEATKVPQGVPGGIMEPKPVKEEAKAKPKLPATPLPAVADPAPAEPTPTPAE